MRTRYLIWLGVSALTVLTYWDVWSFDFVNLDDPQYVLERPHVLNGLSRESIRWACTTLEASNWHPLTWLSLMLDVTVFGSGPAGFHITSLVLHVLNAVLVFEFFRRVTGCQVRSACIAILFAVHPVHAESVAWISERKDVLSTLFGLVALRAYAEYVLKRDGQWYWLAIIAFVLCMLAKQTLVTLPCLLLVLDIWPLGRLTGAAADSTEVQRVGIGRLLWEKIPFFLITAVFCAIVIWAQSEGGAIREASLSGRLANASLAYVLHLKSLCVPVGLAMFYPREEFTHPVLVAAVCGSVLAVITVLTLLLWKRAGWLAIGWFWYLGTLVPVIGLVEIGRAQRADRYLYIPALGIYLVVVWAAAAAFEQLKLSKRGRIIIVCMTLMMLTATSFTHTRTFRNSIVLWKHARKVTPVNVRTEIRLARALAAAGRVDEAETHCLRSLELQPDYAEAHHTYGMLLFEKEEHQAAAAKFERATELNPEYVVAHVNLAVSRWRQEQLELAEISLRKAVEVDPDFIPAQYYLGRLLSETQRYAEARVHLLHANKLDPSNRRVRFELRQLSQ